jgi:hypothetical protein
MAATAALQREESFSSVSRVCIFFLRASPQQNKTTSSFYFVCICVLYSFLWHRCADTHFIIVTLFHTGTARVKIAARQSRKILLWVCVAYNLAPAEWVSGRGGDYMKFHMHYVSWLRGMPVCEREGTRAGASHFARNYIEISRWENDLILFLSLSPAPVLVWRWKENSRRILIKYGRVQQSIKIKCWIASLLQ